MYKVKLKQDINGNWRHTKRGYYASDHDLWKVLNYALNVKNISYKRRHNKYKIKLYWFVDTALDEYKGKHRIDQD